MFKYLPVVYALFLMTPTLYADAEFCEEGMLCDEETKEISYPYLPSADDFDAEELESVTGWPGLQRDPFMDALSR